MKPVLNPKDVMNKRISKSHTVTLLMCLDITYRTILRVFEAIAKHDLIDSYELSTLSNGFQKAIHAKSNIVNSDTALMELDMLINDDVSHYAFDRSDMRNVQRKINALLIKEIGPRIHKLGSEYINQGLKNEYINHILIPVEESIQEHIDPRQPVSSLIPGGDNYGIVSITEEYDESVLYQLKYVSGKADSVLRIKSGDDEFLLMDILAGDDLQEVFDKIFQDKLSLSKKSEFPSTLNVGNLINNRFRHLPEGLRKTMFSTKTLDKHQRRLTVNTVITEEMLTKRGFERTGIDEYLKTLKK